MLILPRGSNGSIQSTPVGKNIFQDTHDIAISMLDRRPHRQAWIAGSRFLTPEARIPWKWRGDIIGPTVIGVIIGHERWHLHQAGLHTAREPSYISTENLNQIGVLILDLG